MEEQTVSKTLGGQTLTISTGKMAKLAGGSAVVQLGDTVVLVAASAAKTASPNRDFVPLDGGLSRADLRRREDPRRFLQA